MAATATALPLTVEDRLRGALWGLFAGDALAAPTHWYYGGQAQIRRDYGSRMIQGYTKPQMKLEGSIMSKSDVNGGGRGSFKVNTGNSIIGDVINHGKLPYWAPGKDYHYHCTLEAGENTLEAQLARVLMRSITANGGAFSEVHFRDAYVSFMTTAGSHNDAYASTCHRMFFSNLKHNGLAAEACPDNDEHNVDTVDGLVLPTVTSLAYAVHREMEASALKATGEAVADFRVSDPKHAAAARTVAVTRNSPMLYKVSGIWGDLLASLVHGDDVEPSLATAASKLGLRDKPTADRAGAMSACYLGQNLPGTLDFVAKFGPAAVTEPAAALRAGLLSNANTGGENVHRGAILGAALGAVTGASGFPPELISGLHAHKEISDEIDAFVTAVTATSAQSPHSRV